MERTGTNKIRVFAIGSLKAISLSATSQTNAPFVMRSTNQVENR